MITGIVLFFFGISNSIFGPITLALVNPNKLKATIAEDHGKTSHNYFDHEVADRVPYMLRMLSIICLIITMLCTSLFKYIPIYPPENDPLHAK